MQKKNISWQTKQSMNSLSWKLFLKRASRSCLNIYLVTYIAALRCPRREAARWASSSPSPRWRAGAAGCSPPPGTPSSGRTTNEAVDLHKLINPLEHGLFLDRYFKKHWGGRKLLDIRNKKVCKLKNFQVWVVSWYFEEKAKKKGGRDVQRPPPHALRG